MTTYQKKNENDWYSLEREEVVQQLKTCPNQGLTSSEAEWRLQTSGLNQLEEAKPVSFWQMVWEQLNSFVNWLLIAATIVSAFIGDTLEAIVIFATVMLNIILGVIQERRAEQSLSALKKMAASVAQVIRDGHHQAAPASHLVPGDLVLLEAGYNVPADIRLIEAINLRIDESALTGESVPAQKDALVVLQRDAPIGDRKNTAYMGTVVNYGRGKGLVVSTGMNTQIGRIASMLQSADRDQTPLQQKLDQLGKMLGAAAIGVCGVVFLAGLLRGREPLDMFMIAVSLAVAAIPEGLPTVVTISLALGMGEMARRHAIIRRLSSVETLGAATVICTDKTGTLTQNQMTATRLWVDGDDLEIKENEYRFDGKVLSLDQYPGALTTLRVAGLNNDGEVEMTAADAGEAPDGKSSPRLIGDPTETALLAAAVKAGIDLQALSQAYPRVQEIPFDANRKRMVTIHSHAVLGQGDAAPLDEEHKDGYTILVKGAPDVVLDLCRYYQKMDDTIAPLTENDRRRILEANEAMTQQALRVLGHAYRVTGAMPDVNDLPALECDLIFTGLIGMIDPPRPEVGPALAKARIAGIRTIMITGDFPNTATAIARSIGLLLPKHQVMTGAEVNRLDDAGLMQAVQRTDVFARVSPEHKMRIVEALQSNGEVVAMTGDGINDAPAIKRADIGIAMGISGTDVAKGSADMILTDDNYASIVSAVEQGRIIYNNIRKFVFFLISSNLVEISVIFLATLAGVPTPLTVIQLLWLNLITDGAPALALAMEKGDPDVMEKSPRKTDEPIINDTMRLGIVIQIIAGSLAVLAAYFLGLHWQLGDVIPDGVNIFQYLLQYDWRNVGVQTAQTMAFVTLTLCQLFRAYTVRSEKESLFKIGVLSNRSMQLAFGASIVLLLIVVNVPFLRPVFNTSCLSLTQWAVATGLALIPATIEEMTKAFIRSRDNTHKPELALEQTMEAYQMKD